MSGDQHPAPARAYLFDLGHVIVDIHYDRFLKALGLDHTYSIDEMLALFIQSGLIASYESGRLSTDRFIAASRDLLQIDLDDPALLAAWKAIIGDEKEGIDHIMSSLAEHCPLYLLSNTNEPHFREAVRRSPSLSFLKEYFLSYELKLLKPDPEIYREAVRRIGFAAEEIIFIDDREDNILSARGVGLNAIRFTDVPALRARLAL
jgi:glucose-1-phosphatase